MLKHQKLYFDSSHSSFSSRLKVLYRPLTCKAQFKNLECVVETALECVKPKNMPVQQSSPVISYTLIRTRCSNASYSIFCYIPCSSTLSNGKEHWKVSLLIITKSSAIVQRFTVYWLYGEEILSFLTSIEDSFFSIHHSVMGQVNSKIQLN